jgi:uncharacterized protein (DUF2252 family)
VQLCGDAHLSNFGVFASPERRLLFDLNDFDETLPGPFEWDVKRMAASFTIAARNNGFPKMDTRAATQASVRAYREAMAGFAQMGTLAIWYAHLSEDDLLKGVRSAAAEASKPKKAAKAAEQRVQKVTGKARTRDSLQALSKLGELVDGRYRIVSQPPVIIPARDVAATYGLSAAAVERNIHQQFRAYRATLRDDQRQLLERFEVVDVARKVVGVGSVGTRAYIVLLQGRDHHDPLFVQVKEATSSVLEGPLPRSRYKQPGERVVAGQRMMQAVSDIFLGWTKGEDRSRHYYWRQLRDMKGSAEIETMAPVNLSFYAGICGWTLARAHARSGDPSPSPGTWAAATGSTGRSPTSPSATPTRTSWIMRPSSRRSDPDDSKPTKVSERCRLLRGQRWYRRWCLIARSNNAYHRSSWKGGTPSKPRRGRHCVAPVAVIPTWREW